MDKHGFKLNEEYIPIYLEMEGQDLERSGIKGQRFKLLKLVMFLEKAEAIMGNSYIVS